MQSFNPYLPSFEYVPDGEPHRFGDRIYIYGSHDRFDSAGFCLNDYVCYSASVYDLTDWKYEGVIYRKEQDPRNQNILEDAPEQTLLFGIQPKRESDLNPKGIHAMWAPDVVEGLDGKYYLYYCLDFLPEIGVAVSSSPAGPFEYHGLVKHADGTPLGDKEGDYLQFDPGIFIDDDRTIYLYSGNAPISLDYKPPRQMSQVMTLEEDMLTLKTEPKKLLPDLRDGDEDFKNHEFFEASSIRKINGIYYFVYSSVRSHELCYATSKYPDKDYHFSGTIVDIGDIFLNGRSEEDSLNHLGNTHGGIEQANGRWYVFYHRQTNRTNFSRQGCAQEILFTDDGSILQAEVTSCGMNGKALSGSGTYPAYIACALVGKKGAASSHPDAMKMDYPYFSQDILDTDPTEQRIKEDKELPVQFIKNFNNGSIAGYKYFHMGDTAVAKIEVRGEAAGKICVRALQKQAAGANSGSIHSIIEDRAKGSKALLIGEITVTEDNTADSDWKWIDMENTVSIQGEYELILSFEGTGSLDIRRFHIDTV